LIIGISPNCGITCSGDDIVGSLAITGCVNENQILCNETGNQCFNATFLGVSVIPIEIGLSNSGPNCQASTGHSRCVDVRLLGSYSITIAPVIARVSSGCYYCELPFFDCSSTRNSPVQSGTFTTRLHSAAHYQR